MERAVTAAPPPAAAAAASPRRLVDVVLRLRDLRHRRSCSAVFVLVTALIQSRFVDGANIRFILTQTSLYALRGGRRGDGRS